MIQDIFDKLGKEDTYSMMCILLFAMSDNPWYSTLNELAYLLDSRGFINILKYYEGQTITIPTLEESKIALRILLLYQYYKVEKNTWEKALEMSGFSQEESSKAKMYLTHFLDKLGEYDYKEGGIKNVFKF